MTKQSQQNHEALMAAMKTLDEPTRFKGDYTQIPRGRVVWEVNKFVVFVGKNYTSPTDGK